MWQQKEILTVHRKAIAEDEGIREIIGVLETTLYLLQGRSDLKCRFEKPLDPLERFVIRCLLELTSCTDQQIASLLGFGNVSFVSAITEELERDKEIFRRGSSEDWIAMSSLHERHTRGTKFIAKSQQNVGFWYEWTSETLFPPEFQPFHLERAELYTRRGIELDSVISTQWAMELTQ